MSCLLAALALELVHRIDGNCVAADVVAVVVHDVLRNSGRVCLFGVRRFMAVAGGRKELEWLK